MRALRVFWLGLSLLMSWWPAWMLPADHLSVALTLGVLHALASMGFCVEAYGFGRERERRRGRGLAPPAYAGREPAPTTSSR